MMELPNESDILALPGWAILAFAARCSRLALDELFKSRLVDSQFRLETVEPFRSANTERDDRLNRLARALEEDEDAAAEADTGKAAAVGGTGSSFVKRDGSDLDAVADSVTATAFCGFVVASPIANPFSGKPMTDYSPVSPSWLLIRPNMPVKRSRVWFPPSAGTLICYEQLLGAKVGRMSLQFHLHSFRKTS